MNSKTEGSEGRSRRGIENPDVFLSLGLPWYHHSLLEFQSIDPSWSRPPPTFIKSPPPTREVARTDDPTQRPPSFQPLVRPRFTRGVRSVPSGRI